MNSSFLKLSTNGGNSFADQVTLGTNTRWGAPGFFLPANYSFGVATLLGGGITNILNIAYPGPALISLSTTTGTTAGGTTVTLNGANIGGATAVTFAGSPATVVSRTINTITVTTPAGSAGAADVSVTTLGGTANSTGAFTYAASQQSQPTAQAIIFSQPTDMTVGDNDQSLIATATSGLSVTFASTTPSFCTISNGAVHAIAAGTCSITASQAGNGTYAAANDASWAITINAGAPQQPTAQSITFTQPADMTVGDSDQRLYASATSGLTVTYLSADTLICTVANSRVHAVAAGICSITASQAGNGTYAAANDASWTLNVSAAPQQQQFRMPTPPSPQQVTNALNNITNLFNSTLPNGQGSTTPATTPTVNDFGSLGVIGVSPSNLAKVNQALAQLPADQLASSAVIQAVINQVNQQITAISNIASTGAAKATVSDFTALGSIAVTANNLAAVQAAIAASPASVKSSPAAIQAIVTKVITDQINAVTVAPAPATANSVGTHTITLSALPKDATVTVTQPNVAVTAKVVAGVVKLTPDSSFSGKVSVPVTISEAGIAKTVTVQAVVSPDPVHAASVVIAPIVSTNGATKTITFQPTLSVALPKNATGYQLLVNNQVVATSTGSSITTNAAIKPTDVVTIVATGNDGTLSNPIPVKVSTTTSYAGSVVYYGKSATLAKSGKSFLDSVISSALNSGLTTVTLNQIVKSGLSSSLSLKQLNAVAQYITSASKGKIKLKLVKGGVSSSSSIDLIVG